MRLTDEIDLIEQRMLSGSERDRGNRMLGFCVALACFAVVGAAWLFAWVTR